MESRVKRGDSTVSDGVFHASLKLGAHANPPRIPARSRSSGPCAGAGPRWWTKTVTVWHVSVHHDPPLEGNPQGLRRVSQLHDVQDHEADFDGGDEEGGDSVALPRVEVQLAAVERDPVTVGFRPEVLPAGLSTSQRDGGRVVTERVLLLSYSRCAARRH